VRGAGGADREVVGDTAFDNIKGAGDKHDIVVMDDFIYGEPRPID
jgi:hypothetical protein